MITNWINRWKMRQVVKSLEYATNHGLRKGVLEFAKTLEATSMIAAGGKKDQLLTLQTSKSDLQEFITYMTRLHTMKLGLLLRARIGLAVLIQSNKQVLGEEPEELIAREKARSVSSKDDNVIQLK